MKRLIAYLAGLFMDDEFWKDYIIIEPTESRENAIGRLRR